MIKILQIVVYFIFILLTVLITGFSIGIIQYILHIRFHHVVMALLIGLNLWDLLVDKFVFDKKIFW